MPGVDLFLVPYNGGFETRVSAVEAKSQQTIEDPVRETRLSELLDQRGVDVRFMFTERGVLMHGTAEQAMVVNRLVSDLENLTPSERAVSATSPKAANDESHVASIFTRVARASIAASMRPSFSAAANDEAPALRRGIRPSINGSQMRLAA